MKHYYICVMMFDGVSVVWSEDSSVQVSVFL